MRDLADEVERILKGERGRVMKWYAYTILTTVCVGVFFPLSGLSLLGFNRRSEVHYVRQDREGP